MRSRSPRSSREPPSSRKRESMRSRSPMRQRSPMRSRPRSPRSSRGQPSHPRFQDLPQPRSGERESFEGHHREHYYRHRDTIRGHNPRITCHNCGEKGHISSQCSNQNSQQDRRRVQQFGRGSPAQRFGGFGGSAGPAQSPRRSLDNSRTSRDTDFGKR